MKKNRDFDWSRIKFTHKLNYWKEDYIQSLSFNTEILEKEENLRELLENIDVLVDSPFILELKSYNVPFRGSSNQRIIDSKKSIKENKVCEVLKYKN